MQLVGELWRFRLLTWALICRHVATRYRGSVLGFLWSIINPLCLMAVYTLVFKHFIRFETDEAYHLMLLAGLLPWIWTASALSEGTGAVVGSGHLVTKSMFPAHVLVFVATSSTLVNFVLSLPILVIFVFAAKGAVPLTILLVPLLMIVHFIMLQGLSLALASLNVVFRDVQHLVQNVLSFLFFLCPIVYPASAVPERFGWLVRANPFALLTEGYRDLLLRGIVPPAESFLALTVFAGAALCLGAVTYAKLHERFAESL